MPINTDPKTIEEILSRSVANVLPSKEEFMKVLQSGAQLKIYTGADPTGPDLHIGHTTNLILLEKLRRLGHEVIILFGDFTALVGDPTDKEAARKRLTREEVEANMRTWKEQAGKVLNFSDKENPSRILQNGEWLSKLTFGELIDITANFTVGQMLERDMFEERMRREKPIYLHEFWYPVMQGYDSVAMNVDAEVGGTDQLFNMLVGRTLQKKLNNKEKFVIATTLLENPRTGKKLMSKSEGNYIALSDTPGDMYGKTMALPDETIIPVFTDCTMAPDVELDALAAEFEGGANPRDIKMRLAHVLVSTYHGKDEADTAQADFVATFQKQEGMPADAPEISVSSNTTLLEAVLGAQLVDSKNELRRLLDQGAISDANFGTVLREADYILAKDIDLKIGKKRFLKIRVK